MKKIAFCLMLFTMSFSTFSQEATQEPQETANKGVITSQEEYNYLTKGYPQAIELGLGIKEGYEFKTIKDFEYNGFKLKYQYLIHTESQEKKALSIIVTKLKSDRSEYLCLPFNNAELLTEYLKSINGIGLTMRSVVDVFNTSLLSNLIEFKANQVKS
ncbi:hypothetical protein [Mangrovimonas sp. DI 80]|uniref:hypothetical protein n=1 Tax=Mangrovimonas sp. DI 80 TaxID=1779330 RepID=UPI000F5098FF|nr:hypothetical protein [Mangrovimonas sp. DI 80]